MSVGEWCILVVGIAVVALIAWICIKTVKAEGNLSEREIKQLQNQPPQPPKTTFLQAKVLGKRIHTYYVGIKISKSETEYWVNFRLENGEEREYYVSKELFDRVEEGQESTLVLLNGMFFDFGEGEDIDGE